MLKIKSNHYIFFIFCSLFYFFDLNNALAACIKSEKANLRSGPGKGYQITWVVGKYMPLIEIEWQGPWIHVEDLDGKTHWVHESLLTSDFQCVVVKKRRALLYKNPSTQSLLTNFRQVDKYTPFKRIRSQGKWYYLEDPFGQKSWVKKNKVWRPLRVAPVSF